MLPSPLSWSLLLSSPALSPFAALFFVAVFLVALFIFTGTGILLVYSGLGYCSLDGWLQVFKKHASDVFSQLLAFEHVFYPLDFAKGDSLYLTQIKLLNDTTTFIGRRNVCNDFVDVGFPSFDFSGPCLGSSFLHPPAAGFQICSGSEFVQLLCFLKKKKLDLVSAHIQLSAALGSVATIKDATDCQSHYNFTPL